MALSRRSVLSLAGSALAAPALIPSVKADTPTITLKLHHFLPPVSNPHRRFLEPWAKKLAADSGGRIKVDIFPSMQLGGTPAQLYDQARDGVVDIVWTLPGSTPGRFPATEAFELPFIADRRSLVTSKACAEYAGEHLAAETKDVKLLCFWAHDQGVLHANRRIAALEDLKGLKLRFPTRLAGESLKALGAIPVGMPVPQVPESLAQRVIDGCVVPWEVVPAIKVHELVRNHTEIPGTPTFYTATFMLAMNRARYDQLPPDLRRVIDDNSGLAAATMAGAAWDAMSADVADMVAKRGNAVTVISEAEKQRWIAATRPVVGAWIAGLKDKGLDGGKLIDAATVLLAKHARG